MDHGPSPEALCERGAGAYAEDRFEEARADWERSFAGYRRAGEPRPAARMAMLLAELHWSALGNPSTGRGWLERARRLLEQVGECVEWGYWELARLACDRPDIDDLARSADRAVEIAIRYGDVDLEARALADSGLALVTQGRVAEGFSRLDEAFAALTSGEVTDPLLIGTSFCSLLSSCDRAGDLERAREWIRVVYEMVLEPTGGRPRVLSTHCQLAIGSVLCATGQWTEAEKAILAGLDAATNGSATHRAEATARLADLRLQQGRVDEAAELLAPMEDHLAVAAPLAAVHLQRGQPALAVAVLRRAIRHLVGDVLRGAPLLSVLVEAELADGDTAAAQEAAGLLRTIDAAVTLPLTAGLAALAGGRIASASRRPGEAVEAFEDAIAHLTTAERPSLAAVAHLELAEAHTAAGAKEAAVAAARAAHAAGVRLQSSSLCDRSAALLRRLGATPPRSGVAAASALAGLTPREVEVLDGLRRGDSNAEIAARLYLSPKTVEHHVSRVLAKLGVRTRAEAAAVAAAAAAGAGGDVESTIGGE